MTAPDLLVMHAATVEALIFASDKPVRERELLVHLPDNIAVGDVLALVAKRYDSSSGVELCQVGDSWAFRTRPEIAERLSQHKQIERPLSRAALEVLAIIAYHQPVTRAEIEEIRGISLSKGTMDILLELGWIKPRGRRRTPGRPLTWGTSPAFLDHFGLAEISDLPGMDDLKAAGLLRKGQILGAMMDHGTDDLEADADESDEDLLEDSLLEAGFDGEDNADL
ncbi:MAG: SMC-Scp complex subunit ScpB [Alphaproteobacteria bacterium]|nr:SMC-Scp complex subunit ScpB [Alphaproteobacteria bacterium]